MESLRGGATAVPALLAGALVLTPPATPQPRVRLLGAKAARDRLRPVCAAPLSASVREADGAAAARARSRVANLSGRWLKDWAASDSMVRARPGRGSPRARARARACVRRIRGVPAHRLAPRS